MKFCQLLFTFLILNGSIYAPDAEINKESVTSTPKTPRLNSEEMDKFKSHLDTKAQEHYKDTWFFKDHKIENYKQRAQSLDNEIKQHLAAPNKLNDLDDANLTLLQEKVQKRLEKEEEGFFNQSSKGLRDDLTDLLQKINSAKKVKTNESQIKSQEIVTQYSKETVLNEINNLIENEATLSTKQNELETLLDKQASIQRDIANAELLKIQTINEGLANAIETRNKEKKEELKKLNQEINKIKDETADTKDTAHLTEENISENLLAILDKDISPEVKRQLNKLISAMESNQFETIDAYLTSDNPKEISDKKINDINAIIAQLENLNLNSIEVKNYIQLLKQTLKNNFLDLENKALEELNLKKNDSTKVNLKIKELELTSTKIKNISKSSTLDDLKKIKNYIDRLNQEILEDQKELEKLQGDLSTDTTKIDAVKNSIQLLEKERNEELQEQGLTQKDLENIELLPQYEKEIMDNQAKLKIIEQSIRRLSTLPKFFQNKAQQINI